MCRLRCVVGAIFDKELDGTFRVSNWKNGKLGKAAGPSLADLLDVRRRPSAATTTERDTADNRGLNFKGTPLGRNTVLGPQSISTGLPQADPSLADDGPDAEVEQRQCAVPPDLHGWRVDRALARLVPEFSRSYLQQLLEDGAVTLRGQSCAKSSQRVAVGDALGVQLRPTPQAQAFVMRP